MANQSTTTKTNSHTWKFFRAGGFDQVRLQSGADLMALDRLDQKLWVALACPTRGIEFDTKTLDLIDTDKDGRIRAPEIIAAANWAGRNLKNPDDLLKSSPSLPLSAINDATPEGKPLLASAKQILINLGKSDVAEISIDDTTDTVRIFAQTVFNGDGVIVADSAGDDPTRVVINDIINCLGAQPDRSGKPGIDQAKVDLFFAEAQAFADWNQRAEADAVNVLPLGASTAGAHATFKAVKVKVDDYFSRCRLAMFDARAQGALNRQESEYLALAANDLSIAAIEIAGFPLARVEASKPLPLIDGVNPAWSDAIAKLHAEVVKPLVGERTMLTESEWAAISRQFSAYDAWLAAKTGGTVEKLGLARVREILAGKTKDAIDMLITKDKALEPEATAITAVDQLVRYHRDLYKLLNNFVAFRDFYGRKDKAVFQAGTLYLDQRSCDLCLIVADPAKHATLAGLAGAYLAYCDVVRKATGEKMQIAAAFTDGDSDNLMVGRNGIFYDRKGRDWDATITKIIDNPISIRQAFLSPYKKFVRMIEEQVAKRAAAAEAAATAKLEAAAAATTTADKPKPPEAKKVDVGAVAAISVAISGAVTALTLILGYVFGLKPWQYPLVLVGLVLVISGPSMLIAWLKLRKRNLGPILDANGWAVNAKAKINVPFGKSLTQVAALPRGSRRDFTDPFAESNQGRNWLIVMVVLLAALWGLWNFGAIERILPGVFPQSAWVKQRDDEAKRKQVETTPTAAAPAAGATAPNSPAAPK